MPYTFTIQQAKSLINEHENILKKFNEIEKSTNTFRSDVYVAITCLMDEENKAVLQNTSIDEINRKQQGFRTKLLKAEGYNTIADISGVSPLKISSIKGIGKDTSTEIYKAVNEIVSQAKSNVRLKISTDNQSTNTTKVILATYKYKLYELCSTNCKSLLDSDKNEIIQSINELKPSASLLGRLFRSKNKEKAEYAYNYLSDKLSGAYGKKAESLFQEEKKIRYEILESDAWNDFVSNSVSYFNVIEKVYPGVLGNTDSNFGLPQELSHEIENVQIDTDGLLCSLRKYQTWGVKYILHQKRVLLGDEMGLGKTIEAIATMVSLQNAGCTHYIVVCPASILTNWYREVSNNSNLKPTVVHGTDREKCLHEWLISGGVAITTYETTKYFIMPVQSRCSLLVVDEAHYIKNPEANRTINVIKLCNSADRLLFMTGTALENNVSEMIGLMKILQPETARKVYGIESLSAAPRFRELIAPVYYRRRREDVLTELPELIEEQAWCDLLPEEKTIYEKVALSSNYMDSRRVSWNISDLSKSSKAIRILEIIEDARIENRKVLVFSFFLDTLSKLKELLGEKAYGPINGGVPPQRRQEIIDEFDRSPNGSVLIAQILSGGTGLNIQSASIVVICEPQFKPSTENQAISRAYRMGQTRNVLVYHLLSVNTVDEKLTRILKAKQRTFDAFADESEAARKDFEIDSETFGKIMKEEADRIMKERQSVNSN